MYTISSDHTITSYEVLERHKLESHVLWNKVFCSVPTRSTLYCLSLLDLPAFVYHASLPVNVSSPFLSRCAYALFLQLR